MFPARMRMSSLRCVFVKSDSHRPVAVCIVSRVRTFICSQARPVHLLALNYKQFEHACGLSVPSLSFRNFVQNSSQDPVFDDSIIPINSS
jgi:hypothetical protein